MTDYIEHKIPLRLGQGYMVAATLKLPADLTHDEADRLGRFVGALADAEQVEPA